MSRTCDNPDNRDTRVSCSHNHPCAGVVVFYCENWDELKSNASKIKQNLKVVLVQTHSGHWGFPKGKRKSKEEMFNAALRELEEETNITKKDIQVFPQSDVVSENSLRGNPATLYYVGRLDHSFDLSMLKVQDEDELKTTTVICLDQAETLLDDRRNSTLVESAKILFSRI